MVDNAVKRTSRTAAKDSEDKDHAAESEGEGQDSRKEEIDRGGVSLLYGCTVSSVLMPTE